MQSTPETYAPAREKMHNTRPREKTHGYSWTDWGTGTAVVFISWHFCAANYKRQNKPTKHFDALCSLLTVDMTKMDFAIITRRWNDILVQFVIVSSFYMIPCICFTSSWRWKFTTLMAQFYLVKLTSLVRFALTPRKARRVLCYRAPRWPLSQITISIAILCHWVGWKLSE